MNKFERGFMTVGASLLGAVLVALPILAQNMLATPSSAPSVDPSAGTTGLTAIQLESQNTALRDEIKSLSAEITKYKLASIFIRPTLKSGNKGDDVKGLQLFLSAIPGVYPENIQSGIFGPTTERAVRVFQDREGLTVNGAVDEETMSKIFDLITGSELDQENAKVDAILASSTPQVLTISDTSLNNSVGTTSTDSSTSNTSTQNTSSSVDPNSTDAVSSYLDQINQFLSVDLTPPTLTTILTPSAPTLSATTGALCGGNIDLNWSSGASGLSYLVMRDGVQILQTTNITFSDTGLSPGTVHTYTITATDGVNSSSSSNTASASASNLCTGTTTQTIKAPAPVISNISVSGVNQNSATITWNTDINSDGQVEYGKTVTYGTKTTINSQLLTTHSATLTGLTTKTTYHYAVISTSNGSIGTSTDKTFLTN